MVSPSVDRIVEVVSVYITLIAVIDHERVMFTIAHMYASEILNTVSVFTSRENLESFQGVSSFVIE